MHTETRGQPATIIPSPVRVIEIVHPSLNSHILFYSNGLPNLAQYVMYTLEILRSMMITSRSFFQLDKLDIFQAILFPETTYFVS